MMMITNGFFLLCARVLLPQSFLKKSQSRTAKATTTTTKNSPLFSSSALVSIKTHISKEGLLGFRTRFFSLLQVLCRNTHTFESKREEEEEEWVRRCTTAWRRTCTWRKRRSSGSRLASSLGAGGSIRTGNAEGKSRGTTRKCQRIRVL